MDKDTLVSRELEDGQKFLAQLIREGIDVTAAAWIQASETTRWYLYVASKVVEDEGLGEAIGKVGAVLRRMPDLWLDQFAIRLIRPSTPVARDLLAAIGQSQERRPIRYRGRPLGELSINEAFLYPPPSYWDRQDAPAANSATP